MRCAAAPPMPNRPTLPSICVLVCSVALAACDARPTADDEAIGENAAPLRALGPPGTMQEIPIPRRSFWSYDDTGTDLGTAWRLASPNVWPYAPGPLGYG